MQALLKIRALPGRERSTMGTPGGTVAGTRQGDHASTPAAPQADARPGAEPPARPAARVALVGVHGFGTHHLRNLERLQAAGVVELVAVADPHPPAPGSVPPTAIVYPGLAELLAETRALDAIIV